MHIDATGGVIFISNRIEILKSETVTQILSKKLYYDFITDLSNAIQKLWEKISFHKYFNKLKPNL